MKDKILKLFGFRKLSFLERTLKRFKNKEPIPEHIKGIFTNKDREAKDDIK